jgi:hypothetical protein
MKVVPEQVEQTSAGAHLAVPRATVYRQSELGIALPFGFRHSIIAAGEAAERLQLVNPADACPVWFERWDREVPDGLSEALNAQTLRSAQWMVVITRK